VEAVAARDDVAFELLLGAVVPEADAGAIALDSFDRLHLRLEQDRLLRVEARRDQILHDLLLPVDGDAAAAGELRQRDAVVLAVEAQPDPVVNETLSVQALREAGVREHVDAALLEHARSDPLLDVLATARLEDDGLDPFELEKVRERQPAGARADDSDLRPQRQPSMRRTILPNFPPPAKRS
jgi:hypothetical protein